MHTCNAYRHLSLSMLPTTQLRLAPSGGHRLSSICTVSRVDTTINHAGGGWTKLHSMHIQAYNHASNMEKSCTASGKAGENQPITSNSVSIKFPDTSRQLVRALINLAHIVSATGRKSSNFSIWLDL